MKILIHKNVLLAALQQAAKAVASKAVIPVLSGVLLEAKFEGLYITGRTPDFAIRVNIPVEDYQLEQPGAIVIPAKEFMSIVKAMPNSYINVEDSKHQIVLISSGKTRLEVSGMAADEYPSFPEIDASLDVTMHGRILRSLIKRTLFAAAAESRNLPIITGIMMRTNDGKLIFTSTDRNRMARAKEITDINLPDQMVISSKHTKEIIGIFNDTDPVGIFADRSQALFSQRNVSVFVSILDGTYPDIDKLFFTSAVTTASFGVDELTQSIERVKLTAEPMSSDGHLIKLEFQKKCLILSSRSEAGRAEDTIHPISYDGAEFSVWYNARYLLDVLQVIEASEVLFRFAAVKGVCMLNAPNHEDLFLISPVKQREGT